MHSYSRVGPAQVFVVGILAGLLIAACDPGYSVLVRNDSGTVYFVGNPTLGIFRVPGHGHALGPAGLGERSEPIFLYNSTCEVIQSLGRLGNADYLIVISPDGSATITAARVDPPAGTTRDRADEVCL
jgi:hypothetical protein